MNLVDFALFSSRRKYIEELVCLKLLANHPALNSRRQWAGGHFHFRGIELKTHDNVAQCFCTV